jgi:hypothetical protein
LTPGRSCPLHYRYPPCVFEREADFRAETLYVIGGLYGNVPALDEVERMAARERVPPVLVFNGDFNWLNIDADTFAAINRRVLGHTALRGNVETELGAEHGDAGCGCAYPDYVEEAEVERSNAIMRRLAETARAFPDLVAALAQLPMHAVAEIGGQRVGIVHGDAESLAGWRFAHDALHDAANADWLTGICVKANLTGFASSHTCLPTLRTFGQGAARRFVANNGAAGMPNFSFTQYGLVTRLSVHPAAEGLAQYGEHFGDLHVDALPVHYDAAAFDRNFLANWPPGSPAHFSYHQRIANGPAYGASHALGLARAASICA